MQISTTVSLAIGIILAGAATTSCTRAVIHYESGVRDAGGAQAAHTHRNGPPPHAPAHGYRYNHPDGVDLIYESSLGLYIVAGHDHHFYYKDRYYRIYDGSWQTSKKFKGPWKKTSAGSVPRPLRDNEQAAHHKE